MGHPDLVSRGLRAASSEAEEHGLRPARAEILRDASTLLVDLVGTGVVARVATRTAALRPGTAWLGREVAVADFLAAAGLPVVAPASTVPAGPHVRDGLALSFWQRVEELDAPLDARAAGRGLRACHEALEDFRGELPHLAPVPEALRVVEQLAATGGVGEEDAAGLRELGEGLRARVEALEGPLQAVHGDAHLGNALMTADGVRWTDWEDTFRGPVGWDLACLRASAPPFGGRDPARIAAALGAHGGACYSPAEQVLLEARRFQAGVWGVALQPEAATQWLAKARGVRAAEPVVRA